MGTGKMPVPQTQDERWFAYMVSPLTGLPGFVTPASQRFRAGLIFHPAGLDLSAGARGTAATSE